MMKPLACQMTLTLFLQLYKAKLICLLYISHELVWYGHCATIKYCFNERIPHDYFMGTYKQRDMAIKSCFSIYHAWPIHFYVSRQGPNIWDNYDFQDVISTELYILSF